jgi:Zn-dependent M28 family amino/carboxypeptidase
VLLACTAVILYGVSVPGRSYRGATPAPGEEELRLETELRAHVQMLAGTIGQRNVFHPAALEAAANYIRDEFARNGLQVTEQAFESEGSRVRNLFAEIRGRSRPEEILVIGAHYDSVSNCPGANDNASGVAAMLALARMARGREFARTVRFIAFVNEEPPHFQTAQMGSEVAARASRQRGEKIIGMLSLETIGYYSDAKGSQVYPPPFSLLYPDTGNFITFVANYRSRALLHEVLREFRRHARIPSEGAAAPESIPGIGWSDHWAYWQAGYPALMVTDTAPFRYPHYHRPGDTPEKLDYLRMAGVVTALMETIPELTK